MSLWAFEGPLSRSEVVPRWSDSADEGKGRGWVAAGEVEDTLPAEARSSVVWALGHAEQPCVKAVVAFLAGHMCHCRLGNERMNMWLRGRLHGQERKHHSPSVFSLHLAILRTEEYEWAESQLEQHIPSGDQLFGSRHGLVRHWVVFRGDADLVV